MAYAEHTTNGTGLGGRVHALRERLAHWRARRAVYRRTHTELSALNDRELNDLGLHHSDIPRLAREAAGL